VKKTIPLITLLFSLMFSCNKAFSAPILDQENTQYRMGCAPTYNWQQEIQAGKPGLLTGIEFNIFLAYDDTTIIDFGLATGSGWQPDLDFQTTVSAHDGWNFVDVSSAGITLNTGDMFVIDFRRGNNIGLIGGSILNQYTKGRLYFEGSLFDEYYDIAFRTYVDPDLNPVPEPATMLLFGTGMAGLLSSRLRMKNKSKP
jgi:hypothetical protein